MTQRHAILLVVVACILSAVGAGLFGARSGSDSSVARPAGLDAVDSTGWCMHSTQCQSEEEEEAQNNDPSGVHWLYSFPHLHQLLLSSAPSSSSSPVASFRLLPQPQPAESPGVHRAWQRQLPQPLRAGAVIGLLDRPDGGGARYQLVERVHRITSAAQQRQLTPWRGETTAATPTRSQDGTALAATTETYGAQSIASTFALDPFLHSLLPELRAPSAIASASSSIPATTIPSTRSPLGGQPASAFTRSNHDGDDAAESSSAGEHEYELGARVGRGHFGELWRARRVDPSTGALADEHSYVLKRLFVEKGYHVRLSGVREIHFGLRTRGWNRVARLHEWFEEGGALWIVFRNEGTSLSQLMTTSHAAVEGDAPLVTPSEAWTRMKMQSGVPRSSAAFHSRGQADDDAAAEDEDHVVDLDDEDNALAEHAAAAAFVMHHQPALAAGDSAGVYGPFLPSPPPSTVALASTAPSTTSDLPLTVRSAACELPEADKQQQQHQQQHALPDVRPQCVPAHEALAQLPGSALPVCKADLPPSGASPAPALASTSSIPPRLHAAVPPDATHTRASSPMQPDFNGDDMKRYEQTKKACVRV
jgi:hypothetical protein